VEISPTIKTRRYRKAKRVGKFLIKKTMKKVSYLIAITSVAVLASCSSSQETKETKAVETAAVTTEAPAAVPTLTINEADWVEKNLSSVSPQANISLKLPKDAKMEKNGNGGVDIRINDFYVITVGNIAVSKINEAKDGDKGLTVNNASSYINGKVLVDEPSGFVYSMQMKDEENGTKYQPETHFAFYLDKEGAIYSIKDERPLDNFSVAGSAYNEDIAKKIYAIVKSSAKAN
jgi:hypothetical protein